MGVLQGRRRPGQRAHEVLAGTSLLPGSLPIPAGSAMNPWAGSQRARPPDPQLRSHACSLGTCPDPDSRTVSIGSGVEMLDPVGVQAWSVR